MRILLTNDDGVDAPGLWEAARAISSLGDVVISAPDQEQSGSSSAISLNRPLRVKKARSRIPNVAAYAVQGTPADCVIIALERLLDSKVDVVVSGINPGANFGEDILISGTVGAAIQGHLRGIPSIAISVAALRDVKYRTASLILHDILSNMPLWSNIDTYEDNELLDMNKRPVLLNVNLPNLPKSRLKGSVVTHMGRRAYGDSVTDGDDGRKAWYWIGRERLDWKEDKGSDVWAVRNRYVSITPLQTNLTAQNAISSLVDLIEVL